jgi:hypothetical protein
MDIWVGRLTDNGLMNELIDLFLYLVRNCGPPQPLEDEGIMFLQNVG